MPLYDYECEEGHLHDTIRPHTESNEPHICPKCGKSAKRIMSAQFSFEGNGAGFYNNLYQGYGGHNTSKKKWEDRFPDNKDTT